MSVVAALPLSKVTTNSIFSAHSDFMPNFIANSSGTFAIDCYSSTNINTALAYAPGKAPIGDGYMSYGTDNPTSGAGYSGTSLMADVDNVYRFAGQNQLILYNSVLNDNGGVSCSVSLAPGNFSVANDGQNCTFSGTLTINGGAGFTQAAGTTVAGQTPMGAATGNIVMNGIYVGRTEPAQLFVDSSGASQLPFVKNNLSVTGENSVFVNGSSGPAVLQLASLTRVDDGTVSIDGWSGNLARPPETTSR